MRIYDHTHLIHNDIPVYPGIPSPSLSVEFTVEKDGFMESHLDMMSHTGTHMDAPAHMIQDGKTLERMDVSRFTGSAILLDLTHCYEVIRREDLSVLKKTGVSDFLLLYTGWERYWGHPSYFKGFPVLEKEATELLIDMGFHGIGADAVSFDTGEGNRFPNHDLLLGNGILLIENLRGLGALPANRIFRFGAFPLRFLHSDGSPVRAVSWVDF